MTISDQAKLPESADSRAVGAYLDAQARKSFAGYESFLHPDMLFNGLVLNAQGAERIASEMDRFLPAIEVLELDSAAQVEEGEVSRYLVLYRFQLQGQAEPQPLCDHIAVRNGLIERIDNVFDLTRLPRLD